MEHDKVALWPLIGLTARLTVTSSTTSGGLVAKGLSC